MLGEVKNKKTVTGQSALLAFVINSFNFCVNCSCVAVDLLHIYNLQSTTLSSYMQNTYIIEYSG